VSSTHFASCLINCLINVQWFSFGCHVVYFHCHADSTNDHLRALSRDVSDQHSGSDTRDRDYGIGRHDRFFGRCPQYRNTENRDDDDDEETDGQHVALQRQSNNINDVNSEQQVSNENYRLTETDEDHTVEEVEASVVEIVRARWSRSAQQRSHSTVGLNPECPLPVSQVSQNCLSPASQAQVNHQNSSSVLRLNGYGMLQVSHDRHVRPRNATTVINCMPSCTADDGIPTQRSISVGCTSPSDDNACVACPTSVFMKSTFLSSPCPVSNENLVCSGKCLPNSNVKTLQSRMLMNVELPPARCILNTQSSSAGPRTIDNRNDDLISASSSPTPASLISGSSLTSETPVTLVNISSYAKITGANNCKLYTSRRRKQSANWTQIYSRTQLFKVLMKVYSREDCADIGQVFVRFPTGSPLEDNVIPQSQQLSSYRINVESPILSRIVESEFDSKVGMVRVRNDSLSCDENRSLCVSKEDSSLVPLDSSSLNAASRGNIFETSAVHKTAHDPCVIGLMTAKYEDAQGHDNHVVHSNEICFSSSKTESRKDGLDKSPPKLRLSKLPESMTKEFLDHVYDVTCRPTCAVLSVLSSSKSKSVQLSILVTHVDDDQHFWGQVLNDGDCVRFTNVL